MKESITINDLDPKIVRWLEAGQLKQVLLGEGEYFLPNHTYRSSHDIPLVFYVLLEWVGLKQNVSGTSKEFEIILNELYENGDFLKLRDLLTGYQIMSSKKKKLEINLEHWVTKLVNSFERNIEIVIADPELKQSVKVLLKKWPEFIRISELVKNRA